MKTTVKIEKKLDTMVQNVLSQIMPEFSAAIEMEVRKVFDDAKKNWLVKSKNSKRSKDKMKFEIKISGGKLVGSVSNLAQYASAIKVGPKSDTYLPWGKRLADELITNPMKKMSTKLNKKLIDEYLKLQR